MRFLTCHLNWQVEDYLRVSLLSLQSLTGALQAQGQPSQLPLEFETEDITAWKMLMEAHSLLISDKAPTLPSLAPVLLPS